VAEVAETSIPEFLHALDATAGLVAVVSGDGKHALVSGAVGFDPPLEPRLPLSLDSDTLLGRAFTDRELHAYRPAERGNAILLEDSTPLHGPGGVTMIAPLVAGGRTVALLGVGFETDRVLSSDEREFLVAGARRTAEALVRADQYETAQRARNDA